MICRNLIQSLNTNLILYYYNLVPTIIILNNNLIINKNLINYNDFILEKDDFFKDSICVKHLQSCMF